MIMCGGDTLPQVLDSQLATHSRCCAGDGIHCTGAGWYFQRIAHSCVWHRHVRCGRWLTGVLSWDGGPRVESLAACFELGAKMGKSMMH